MFMVLGIIHLYIEDWQKKSALARQGATREIHDDCEARSYPPTKGPPGTSRSWLWRNRRSS